MADDQQSGAPPTQRPRAPTITIERTDSDNNAAAMDPQGTSGQPAAASNNPPSPSSETQSPTTTTDPSSTAWQNARSAQGAGSGDGRPQLQSTASFDNKESRPTSPHNFSSPVTSRGNDKAQGFLSVPHGTHRSRQNSVDSEEGGAKSTTSQGETVVASTVLSEKPSKSTGEGSKKIMSDPTALKPDIGKEAEFEVENNPFAFSPGQLSKMFNPKSLAAFWALGGIPGLEKGLRTDRKAGLSIEEIGLDGAITFEQATYRSRPKDKETSEGTDRPVSPPTPATPTHRGNQGSELFVDRKRVFRDNRLPEKKGKSLLQLIWITFNDKILILLSIAAAVSLGVGLYQTFGMEHDPNNPAVEWIEGVAIIVAIVIVVLVGSLNDWQKERQFARLNRKKTDRLVKVVRSGNTLEISVHDILVGDIVHLETGDMIPVDGILVEGHNIKCDESQTTGESDLIRKRSADEVWAAIENNEELKKMDPFILSGARVMEGVGTFIVTATGVNSSYGKTLMALQDDPEITPLQMKLNVIADYIAKLGGAAALLLFLVLFIQFLVNLPKDPGTPAEKGQKFIHIFIIVVTIIVVAIPEGLPLAVTLALSYATAKMVKENNLVRQLKACEVMGNATNICSDKTGTLTQNEMRIVAGIIGSTHRFGGIAPLEQPGDETPISPVESQEPSAQELVGMLASDVKELLLKSMVLNSTAFEGEIDGKKAFVGSKTESAMLIFAREHLAMGPVSEERANAKILQLIPFDSGRKCMGVVIEMPDGKARLYVKGASEIVLRQCTQILRDPSQDLSISPLTDDNRVQIEQAIETYATSSLRTIGIVYRDFDRWPPMRSRRSENDPSEVIFEDIFKHMVFASMVGIKDPLREGVREAVKECQRAGVIVRMVTGDNRLTAHAIAKDCGILQPNTIVMEGPEFRNLTKAEQNEIIPRLHVLARSSPEDKRILVQRLKEQGETVAVTGDGTNDAPALKLADVGFSMGISGTEVAKEASAIILMDDNFTSIVHALKWGRAVNDAVKRFLQFQLTVNVTAVVLTFISAVSNFGERPVLTAVQLLWVNLIMDTLAALALATDPPHPSVLDRKPERKGAGIISITMWKMILGQAIYQLVITLMLNFGKQAILPAYDQDVEDSQIETLVFNTFVWMQIFNQWNNRRLDNRFNILEGITKNFWFPVISAVMIGGQTLIVMVGGLPFNISPLGQTPAMWGYAIFLGFASIPIGAIIRLIPDSAVAALVPSYIKRIARSRGTPDLTVSDEERFNNYPLALSDVRDELAWLKRYRGGRLSNLKFAMKNPRETFMPKSKSPSHSRNHSRTHSRAGSENIPSTPTRENSVGSSAATPDSRKRDRSLRSRSNSALGAPTVMAGIIAGSVAAGWSPVVDRDADGNAFASSFTRQHSHTSTSGREGSQLGPAFTEEPEEIAPQPATDVPTLSVPQPSPRKSSSS